MKQNNNKIIVIMFAIGNKFCFAIALTRSCIDGILNILGGNEIKQNSSSNIQVSLVVCVQWQTIDSGLKIKKKINKYKNQQITLFFFI